MYPTTGGDNEFSILAGGTFIFKTVSLGEGLAFTASSEEEWCFANAKLEYN